MKYVDIFGKKPPRDIITLLILLRDLSKDYNHCISGLCSMIILMKYSSTSHQISETEASILHKYLLKHRPRKIWGHCSSGFWYQPFDMIPRINWINRQIKRLEKEQAKYI